MCAMCENNHSLNFTYIGQHVICINLTVVQCLKVNVHVSLIDNSRQEGFWEDSIPSLSVNARQKSSIKFATVNQVPGIIKCKYPARKLGQPLGVLRRKLIRSTQRLSQFPCRILTSYYRVTEIAAAVDQVFLPGHFNCHKNMPRVKSSPGLSFYQYTSGISHRIFQDVFVDVFIQASNPFLR